MLQRATDQAAAPKQVEHAQAALGNAEQDAIVVALLLRETPKKKRQQQLHLRYSIVQKTEICDVRQAGKPLLDKSVGALHSAEVAAAAVACCRHADISSTRELKSFMQPTTNHPASPSPNGNGPVHDSAREKGSTPSTQGPSPAVLKATGGAEVVAWTVARVAAAAATPLDTQHAYQRPTMLKRRTGRGAGVREGGVVLLGLPSAASKLAASSAATQQ
ncbi:hypothetical protein ABBQ38_010945 [Trebouxia sp. C0009 RCD-2024]